MFRNEIRPIVAVCLVLVFAIFCIIDEARAGGLDSYRVKSGMVYGLTDIDQNTLRRCTGDLFGLDDENSRVIFLPKYSDIEYCGHGLFLATDVQKLNKYYFGDRRHFFNREGVELNYALPDKAFLLNIFSFGEKADRDSSLVLNKFPSDAMLLFGYRDDPQQGLCGVTGKVLMSPLRGNILFFEPGSAFVVGADNKRSIVNLKTWSVTSTELSRNPGSIPRSRIVWSNNYQVPMPFPKDRIRKVVSADNGQFDHDYWCDKRFSPIGPLYMFGV